jgi:hypothetical protein
LGTGDGAGSGNSLNKLLTASDGYLLAGMGLIGIGISGGGSCRRNAAWSRTGNSGKRLEQFESSASAEVRPRRQGGFASANWRRQVVEEEVCLVEDGGRREEVGAVGVVS